MSYRVGIDIGGRFTDFALLSEGDGRLYIHKTTNYARRPRQIRVVGRPTPPREGIRLARQNRRGGPRHDARYQRGDRTSRRQNRHAGDRGLRRHSRYRARAPLRHVRPDDHLSRTAGSRVPCAAKSTKGWAPTVSREHLSNEATLLRRCRTSSIKVSRPSRSAFSTAPPIRRTSALSPKLPPLNFHNCLCRLRPTCFRFCANTSAGPRPP